MNDKEFNELESLLPLLNPILLSNALDIRIWTLESFGTFSCKSYCQFLTSSPNKERFLLDKLIWKSKSPSKVKAFIWIVVFNQINTNDTLQKRRPLITLSPNICIMRGLDSKSGALHFSYCPTVRSIWIRLLGISGELWVCPMDLRKFLHTKFRGFGSRKEAKILWQSSIFAVLWCIWLERIARIFNDSFSTIDFVWDKIAFLASFWCSTHGLFNSVPLADIQRDCHALLHGLSL